MAQGNGDSEGGGRRILLIGYWYPPAVGAAAERLFGFARHLGAAGWRIHVLTAHRSPRPPDAEGVTVHGVADPLASAEPFPDYDPRVVSPRWKRIGREIIFPDRFVRWRRAALQTGRGLLEAMKFDAVVASFPPASVVQLALKVVEGTNVPLVLDLRDLWFGPGGYDPRSRFVRGMHERLERRAMARAARIVTVSEAMADAMVREHDLPRGRVVVIPNGYEIAPREHSEIAATIDRTRNGNDELAGSIVVSHVGTVIPRNKPELFLAGLQRMSGDPRLQGVQFRFVGNLSFEYVRSLGLEHLVQVTGLVDRDQARREMETADVLLLLTGAYVGQWGLSAKLFEYLQAGRPVLCLEEKSPSNDRLLLERFTPNRAFFAPMNDPEAILAQLLRIREYRLMRRGPALDLDAGFRDFSRANLAARLALELAQVAGG